MKKAYFIGIAGKTPSALAKTLRDNGWEVLGSDHEAIYPPASDYLEQNNISYIRGYREENVSADADIVIVGRGALLHNHQNPEYLKAKQLGLNILSLPQALNRFIVKENSVVVAGTYGKTTITALITWILIAAGLDPSYAIGGEPINMKDGVKITKSSFSVVEGDETPALKETDLPKFMSYKPKFLLLTATKWDHPEVYKNKRDYLEVFKNLVKLLPPDGFLVYNLDSVDKDVVKMTKCRKISYSLDNPKADYFLKNLSFILETPLLGKSNLENICGVIALTINLGISEEVIKKAIKSFKGIKTRLEFLGEYKKRKLYWDLAQHPEKVKGSLEALRETYPKNRIICIFDPVTTGLKYKESLAWYSGAFDVADQVIIGKVSFLKSIKPEDRVTGNNIVEAITKTQPKVFYQPIDEKIIEWLVENSKSGDVIIFMSSGGLEFTKLIEKTKNELGKLGRLGDTKTNKYETLIKLIGSERVKKNVSLADQTTFKIGGPADLFYEAQSEEELVRVIREIRKIGVPYFILGGGSNILVGDKGFRGIVINIKYQISNIKYPLQGKQNENSKFKIYAEAGVPIGVLLDGLMKNSVAGLEFMAGIPGTVGGAVRGNARAWQQNFGDKVKRVKILTNEGEIKWLEQKDCAFGHKESRFKHHDEVILAVEFEMGKDDRGEIEERIKEYLNKRVGQPKEPSAGCIFINPINQPAGMLIDQCGLKGTQIGGAKISEQHANFIVNVGKAKAAEVVELIDLAKKKVHAKFKVDLQEEIVRIGEF